MILHFTINFRVDNLDGSSHSKKVAKIAPKAWEAICEVVGGEKMIEKRTMGIESNTLPRLIVSCGLMHLSLIFIWKKMKHGIPHKQKVSTGTKMGAIFDICDSPEQALLLVILWKDVETQGGGTFWHWVLLMSLQKLFWNTQKD